MLILRIELKMSNEVKLTQEKWNLFLDMKDEVAKLKRVVAANQQTIKKLEEQVKKQHNPLFDDIFKQGR